jgi:hypothetical protein
VLPSFIYFACHRNLQRQRCKNLQSLELPSAFWKQKYFILLRNAVACYNAGVVVVNLEVVGSAPGIGQFFLQNFVAFAVCHSESSNSLPAFL